MRRRCFGKNVDCICRLLVQNQFRVSDQFIADLVPDQSICIGREATAFVCYGSLAQTDTTGLEQILITGGIGLTESTDLLLDDLSHQTHIRFHDFLLLRCHDACTSPFISVVNLNDVVCAGFELTGCCIAVLAGCNGFYQLPIGIQNMEIPPFGASVNGILFYAKIAIVGIAEGHRHSRICFDGDGLDRRITDPVGIIHCDFLRVQLLQGQAIYHNGAVCACRKGGAFNGFGAGNIRIDPDLPAGEVLSRIGLLNQFDGTGFQRVVKADRGGGTVGDRHLLGVVACTAVHCLNIIVTVSKLLDIVDADFQTGNGYGTLGIRCMRTGHQCGATGIGVDSKFPACQIQPIAGRFGQTEVPGFDLIDNLSLTKTTEDGKNLSGWKFGIYSNSACTSLVSGPHTTDSSGRISVTGLTAGTYYVKELRHINSGIEGLYVCSSTNPQKVTIVNGSTASVSFVNKLNTGRLALTKKTDDGSNLSGWRFGIYSDSGCTALISGPHTTDANGTISVDGITPGTYYVKEIGHTDSSINEKYVCSGTNPEKVTIAGGAAASVTFALIS